MTQSTAGHVVLEIDLGGAHHDVPYPVVGRWTEVRTDEGWRLESRLDLREFADLAAALRFAPATARERDGRCFLSLRPVAWPGAVAVTLAFDPALRG